MVVSYAGRPTFGGLRRQIPPWLASGQLEAQKLVAFFGPGRTAHRSFIYQLNKTTGDRNVVGYRT